MKSKLAILSAAIAVIAIASSSAQAQEAAMPEKCKAVASRMNMPMGKMMNMPMGEMMGMPMGEMMEQMHGIKMQDFNKEYMQGMHKTMPGMMHGMMMDDADAAFVCGMIAHHMGAVEMSRTELKFGDNDEAKQMAQKIIDAQLKEIEDMSKWVEANVK